MIGQNHTKDGSGAYHSDPARARACPSIRSGMLHLPTYRVPGAIATIANACSRPSCHSYEWPALICCQLGGVERVRVGGGVCAIGVWFR
jgi:hypothetical protein